MLTNKQKRSQQKVIDAFIGIIESNLPAYSLALTNILDKSKGLYVARLSNKSTTYSHFNFTIHKKIAKSIKFWPLSRYTYRLTTRMKKNGLRVLFRSKQKNKKITITLNTMLQKLCIMDDKLIYTLEHFVFSIKG